MELWICLVKMHVFDVSANIIYLRLSTLAPDRGPAGEPRYRPAGEASPECPFRKAIRAPQGEPHRKTNIGEAGRRLRSRIALSAIEHLEQIANQYPLHGEIARAEIATVRAFNQPADEKCLSKPLHACGSLQRCRLHFLSVSF